MKNVEVKADTIISSPISNVAEYTTDPDNAPEWYRNIDRSVWKSAKPLQVGSHIGFSANFLGKKMSYTYEIKEFIPEKKLVMEAIDSPLAMQTTYLWESVGEGKTRMTLINRGKSSKFFGFLSPLMAIAMLRAMKTNLKDLKKILEKSEHGKATDILR